ncbi:MAG: antitoxin [Ruminococcus sp.]|nr:antitoxin [Ruminococcus sp.]
MKYIKEKRDFIHLNIPKGSKDKYKAHAQKQGKSLTALIIDLLEADMREHGEK